MIKAIVGILVVSIISVPMFFKSTFNESKINSDVDSNQTEVENILPTEDEKQEEPKKEIEVKREFSHSPIPDHIKDKMLGKSMPHNEPINFNSLSYLTLTYYSFDGSTHIGEMIVDKRVASEVVDIFEELYNEKYPIEKIRLIDEYDANDNNSMVNNNSSAFCYRTISGTNKISNHGKGLAIDINPFQNPHVIGSNTSPKESYVYADRTNSSMGMIREGDAAYNAFTKRGWSWGGHWSNPDYQHFEKQL
ncbi:MAG: M15 family metallopeptidase [Romboutsia sp.]